MQPPCVRHLIPAFPGSPRDVFLSSSAFDDRSCLSPGAPGEAGVDAIEGRAGGDEQGSAILAAEDEAGGALGDVDSVDLFAGGLEDGKGRYLRVLALRMGFC